MRGLIAINVESNNEVINDYPLLMYYAGDADNVVSSFKKDEVFQEYLIKNCVHLNTYETSVIYYITYLSDDNDSTPENTSKHEVSLYDIIPVESIYEILMNDALDASFNTHDIQKIKSTGVASSTIINAVRHAALQSGISRERCSVLVKMIQNLIS